jgi:SpoVK/Ycf46/Vps4 family AAA+-type ATPase
MVMTGLKLSETSHPAKEATARYDALIGVDSQKEQLLDELTLLLEATRLEKWLKKHHSKGLTMANAIGGGSPLVLLSGEVGCGKTALATSIGSPLADVLDKKIITLETPSDIRGHGLVGELSARITDAFEQARARVRDRKCYGILIVDEADDLATARDQMQAHHEDRAGVNVLIKQIDTIVREKVPLAVLMITNRARALDPAVVRRAALHLRFERPDETQRRAVFRRLLHGTRHAAEQIEDLVMATEPQHGVSFSFSDLMVRLARSALRQAWRANRPFGPDTLLEVIAHMAPSPLVESRSSEEVNSDA